MKAIILAGGFGTRLRPLTLSRPKPLLDFVDKPLIVHQMEALAQVNVRHVILALNYLPNMLTDAIKEVANRLEMKVSISIEDEPLDTAGPLALAKHFLLEDVEDENDCESDFFVFNSDIMCTFPLQKMVDFHRNHAGHASIMVTRVEEPSKYGVIVYDSDNGLVDRFVEKPKVFVGNMINAGMYLFKLAVLHSIKIEPTSMERDVFPALARNKQLYCFPLDGFWMDVGQPKDYLRGCALYLNHLYNSHKSSLLRSEQMITGLVYMHESCLFGADCKIGPNVVIGENVKIGVGVRLRDCAVLPGCVIDSYSWISNCIIGWNCRIGRWTRIENVSVFGEDVKIKDELYMNGICVLPHKSIGQNMAHPKIVM